MAMFLATDRLHALRQAIHACRKGGTVSIPGVYGGLLDEEAPYGYEIFRDKKDNCIKIVLRP
jgi:threonine dehydrogenase-like Zn-dependent dehydrogenase